MYASSLKHYNLVSGFEFTSPGEMSGVLNQKKLTVGRVVSVSGLSTEKKLGVFRWGLVYIPT